MESSTPEKISKILPNTTQVPHIIIREWMTRLSDVELRVLLIVVDQTLGWEADTETGRRKTEDWISRRQFVDKTGRSAKHISKAIDALVSEHRLIEAVDKRGRLLDSPEKRKAKFGQIYYRLSLHEPAATLFDKPRVTKRLTGEGQATKGPTQNGHTTKETLITKENTMRAEPAPAGEKGGEKPSKPPSVHKEIVDEWWRITQRARGIKPIITAADGKLLKATLERGVSRETIEQAMIYFLYDPSFKTMAPTLKTLLSAGIMTGLLNRMKNGPDFWKRLDGYAIHAYAGRREVKKVEADPIAIRTAIEGLHTLKAALTAKLAMPRTYQPAEY